MVLTTGQIIVAKQLSSHTNRYSRKPLLHFFNVYAIDFILDVTKEQSVYVTADTE